MTDNRLTLDGRARLSAAAQQAVADGKVPGLVLLVASGGDTEVVTAGSLSLDGAPVERDSLFRISSTTKPMTAAATLALIGEGLLGLDEPIDRLLPELAGRRVLRRMDGPLDDTVPAGRAITTRDLLTFTFGFGLTMEMFMAASPWPVVEAASQLRLATLGPPEPAVLPDPDTWIANFGTLPLMAQPGERWLYNSGAMVLGVLLARAAGMPYGEVLRTRVLEPLGMGDTSFFAADTGRLATAYREGPDGLEAWDQPGGDWSRPPLFDDGAAGLVSTADDVLAFSQMLLRGGAPVLPEESARAMVTDQLTPAQKAHGGLGPDFFAGQSWAFGQAVQDSGTFGWDGGLGTSWLADPARDLTVIVLTQRMLAGPGDFQLHTGLREAAYTALA